MTLGISLGGYYEDSNDDEKNCKEKPSPVFFHIVCDFSSFPLPEWIHIVFHFSRIPLYSAPCSWKPMLSNGKCDRKNISNSN